MLNLKTVNDISIYHIFRQPDRKSVVFYILERKLQMSEGSVIDKCTRTQVHKSEGRRAKDERRSKVHRRIRA
jgi:hypothetical protein